MAEAAHLYPLFEAITKASPRLLAYGKEMNNRGMGYINAMKTRFSSSYFLMGDWSSYDTTVPA